MGGPFLKPAESKSWFEATAAEFADADPILPSDSIALETDTGLMRRADGVTPWSGLSGLGSFGVRASSSFVPNYTTPIPSFGDPWVGYGMDSRLSTALDVHGQEIYLPLTLTDAVGPQTVIGSSVRLDLQGTPAGSGSTIGNLVYIFTNSFSNPNQTIYGNFTSVDIGGPHKNVYGGYFQAAIGSVGAGITTDSAIGIYGAASASYNQAAVEMAIGGDFRVSSSQSVGGVTVPLAIGTRIRANMSTDTTFTDLRGISIADWTVGSGGGATTSYGIYADSSIDVGATKYFIYSLSTSPSRFMGDIAIRDSAKGLILTSPDGTCYRFTVANGGALSAGAPVTFP